MKTNKDLTRLGFLLNESDSILLMELIKIFQKPPEEIIGNAIRVLHRNYSQTGKEPA